MRFLIAIFLMALSGVVFASEVNPALEGVVALLGPYLGDLAVKFPWVGSILKVMLWCRIIVKPVMSALVEIGKDLPEGGVRKFLLDMSGHTVYKYVAFFLDWFASIKLPKKENK